MTKTRGVRIPEELEQEIARHAEALGKSWSAMTKDLLEEALRMRKTPGIIFVDGPAGRRAVIAGSGLDVWEVIATWRAEGETEEQLAQLYPWLTRAQLRAALSYYRLYPAEIDQRLEIEASWTPERLRRELPFSTPG
jgi:uncharacterized protein (DUF433 family)